MWRRSPSAVARAGRRLRGRRRAAGPTSIGANPLTALPARFRPDRFTLTAAAVATLGAVLVRAHGVVLSPDSAHYIAFARSLLAGEGFLDYTGSPDTAWPPLYPLLLAAASLGTFDPLAVAGPLNAVVFGLTVFVVGRYLRQRLESRFLAAWGCLATALAPPLTGWSSWALSDPLFILLAVLALIRTDRFLTDGRLRTLVWAAVFSALAWQTRYVGGAVPAVVGLLLLLHPGGSPSMARRAGRVAVHSLIVAVPTALWFLRNYLVTGDLTKHGSPVGYPVSMMLRDVLDILWSWALANGTAALVPFVCILVAVRWRRLSVAGWDPLWVFGGFALTYLVLFIVAISLVFVFQTGGSISERYLIPMYVPLLVAGAFVLDRVLVRERERPFLGSVGNLPIVRATMPGKGGSVLAAIVAIVLSLGVASQAVMNVYRIAKASRGDLYLLFNGPRWTGSGTLRHVRENLAAERERTYTNAPYALSLHVNRNREYAPCCRHLWKFRVGRLGRRPAKIPDGAYVVWFRTKRNSQLLDYGEAELRSLPVLEPVAELADGVVFRVKR